MQIAAKAKEQVDAADTFNKPIATIIKPAGTFYEAEAYHQDYYENNIEKPYCKAVIQPKMEKLKKVFGEHLD